MERSIAGNGNRMKKEKSIQLSDLTDSRVYFERRPPRFMFILIYMLLVGIVVFFGWAACSQKEVTIKVSGVVEAKESNLVKPLISGVVSEIFVQEGSFVKKGDTLFTIYNSALPIEDKKLQDQENNIKSRIGGLERYKESILTGENLLNRDGLESEYYYRFETYITQIIKINNSIETEKQRSFSNEEKQKKEKVSEELIEQEKIQSEKLIESYKFEKQILHETELGNVSAEIQSCQEQLLEIENQVANYNMQNAETIVKAGLEGTVHFIADLKQSELVAASDTVIRINSLEGNQLKVKFFIPSNEIGKIEIGQSIKFNASAFSYREYGFINGIIEIIASDSIFTEEGSSLYIASFLTDRVHKNENYKNKIVLKVGMPVEGRIIVEKKSYLQYYLEKLDLWLVG